MRFPPQEGAPAPWERLGESLAGSFSARPRGLVAPEFALFDRAGAQFGRLLVRGTGTLVAELDAGSLRARIERGAGPGRYRMLTGAAETLVAEPAGSSVALIVRCGDRSYEAGFGLLRNTATARPAGGGETARLAGGIASRRYEVLFDAGDGCSLPVALFLLYHAVALRRRVFLTG
jgi:hypothetical protein